MEPSFTISFIFEVNDSTVGFTYWVHKYYVFLYRESVHRAYAKYGNTYDVHIRLNKTENGNWQVKHFTSTYIDGLA